MHKLKKIAAILLSLVFLLSAGSYNSMNTQAVSQVNHNLTIRLTGAGKAKILSGKKNVTKKTVRVAAGDTVALSTEKNKNITSVTYHSSNKNVLTVTKKGKVSIKKNGTARITASIKQRNGKSVTGWVKLRVAGQNSSENEPAGNDSQNPSGSSGQNPSDTPSGNTGRPLVLYFSRAGENYNVGTVEKGSTQIVAEMIAAETGADLFKLETVRTYPQNYMECVTVAQEEKDADARPELRAVPQDLSEYQYIYLGYPIWHADMPMALYTFLETYDLSGKTILPFCTHAGSGLAGTVAAIRGKCQGANVMEGLAISGTTVQNDIAAAKELVSEWLQTSGVRNSKSPVLLYMGQASVRITTEEGRTIYIDPYAGAAEDYGEEADLILVTHAHYDHSMTDKVRNTKPDCRIITHKEAVRKGVHQTFELGYVRVEAVEAGYNDWHDVNECVGYVLTFKNGRSVYVTGDTSMTKQMPELAQKQIDYAFYCCDGVFNMGLEEAAECAGLVGARHNIPYHMTTTASGNGFDRKIAEQFRAPGRMIVEPGEEINIE